jgi:uncharacterized protein YecA (UPF0149 family)
MSETVQQTANRLALELACHDQPAEAARKIIDLESTLSSTSKLVTHQATKIHELQSRLEAYQLALGQIAAFVEQQQQSVKSRDVERQDTECPQCGSKAHAGCPVPNSDLA